MYCHDLFAMIEAIHELWQQLIGQELIFFVSNGAVCGALAKGAATSNLARMLICNLWAVAAQFGITFGPDGPHQPSTRLTPFRERASSIVLRPEGILAAPSRNNASL